MAILAGLIMACRPEAATPPGMAATATSATMFTETSLPPAPPCRVKLLKVPGRHPLQGRSTHITLSIDGSRVGSAPLTSDASGIIDVGPFHASNAALLAGNENRASWHVLVAEKEISLELAACPNSKPVVVTIPLGELTVTGHFADRAGRRVAVPMEVFPSELRRFVKESHNWWGDQIRVEDAAGKGLVNMLQVDPTGAFVLDLPARGRYRFSMNTDYQLVTRDFDVEASGQKIVVRIEPRAYCLYGELFDAKSGDWVTDWISISGLGAYATAMRPRYALFYDEAGTKELSLHGSSFGAGYLAQTMRVDVKKPFQRHDFRMQRVSDTQGAIRVRVELSGVPESRRLSVSVTGSEYFTSRAVTEKNVAEFFLPRAGTYRFDAQWSEFDVRTVERQIDGPQTVRLEGTEKRTRLVVHVVDASGRPLTFPRIFHHHEPNRNTVTLLRAKSADRAQEYAYFGVGDVGFAVRPNEKGNAEFLVTRGGSFELQARFDRFLPLSHTIELPDDQTTAIELVLQEKP